MRDINGLQKRDREGLRSGMIEMGNIKEHPPGTNANTILVLPDFDLVNYKANKNRNEEKKDIDYQFVKKTLEVIPPLKIGRKMPLQFLSYRHYYQV